MEIVIFRRIHRMRNSNLPFHNVASHIGSVLSESQATSHVTVFSQILRYIILIMRER